MKLSEVKKIRQLPFLYRGMRIYHTHTNRWGRIAGGNNSANINVIFDGDNFSQNCHPCWMIKYFDKTGNIIAEYQ